MKTPLARGQEGDKKITNKIFVKVENKKGEDYNA